MCRHSFFHWLNWLVLPALLLVVCPTAPAQIIPLPVNPGVGGVYIDAGGAISFREEDAAKELERVRARANSARAGKDDKLCYVSLPRVVAQVRELTSAGKPVPDELRYLGGMTQLQYILVDPETHDLIIAGPYEPIDASTSNTLEPSGKLTGRPVMHMDDLVVSLRTAMATRHVEAFGCSIDPPSDSLVKSTQVMQQYANASRAERMDAMAKALGPQSVSVFGTANDTRLAFICIAADYRLKRLALGIDAAPVFGVGNSIDASRAGGSRTWFEAFYEPLLVSSDANVFQLRGQRLQLKAGALSFDPKGATEKANLFARQVTQKMPAMVGHIPLFADLQNIADLSVLSALIRDDHLAQKAGWDISWLLDPNGYPVATVPVSRTTPTLVAYTSGSICAGGVSFNADPWVAPSARQTDAKNQLAAVRDQRIKWAQGATTRPILVGP